MDNTQEMFILSKYKYIRHLAKTTGNLIKTEVQSSLPKLSPNITVTIPAKSCSTNSNTNSNQKGMVVEEKVEHISDKASIDKSAEQEAKEKRKADKLAKQEQMKKMCQPSKKKEEKVKFVEKTKYVNETPLGEKKGN
jgi:hypothetical protein